MVVHVRAHAGRVRGEGPWAWPCEGQARRSETELALAVTQGFGLLLFFARGFWSHAGGPVQQRKVGEDTEGHTGGRAARPRSTARPLPRERTLHLACHLTWRPGLAAREPRGAVLLSPRMHSAPTWDLSLTPRVQGGCRLPPGGSCLSSGAPSEAAVGQCRREPATTRRVCGDLMSHRIQS